jgi:RNA polymerase sigma-70 factor (ECF subfamily)
VRDAAALSSWLRTILRRRIVDQRRRSARFAPLDREVESPIDDAPAARHDLGVARPHIASGLAKLPPLEREAVYLVDVSDLDRDVAAAQLKVSRGHLRVLLHRGRARLHEHHEKRGFAQ